MFQTRWVNVCIYFTWLLFKTSWVHCFIFQLFLLVVYIIVLKNKNGKSSRKRVYKYYICANWLNTQTPSVTRMLLFYVEIITMSIYNTHALIFKYPTALTTLYSLSLSFFFHWSKQTTSIVYISCETNSKPFNKSHINISMPFTNWKLIYFFAFSPFVQSCFASDFLKKGSHKHQHMLWHIHNFYMHLLD